MDKENMELNQSPDNIVVDEPVKNSKCPAQKCPYVKQMMLDMQNDANPKGWMPDTQQVGADLHPDNPDYNPLDINSKMSDSGHGLLKPKKYDKFEFLDVPIQRKCPLGRDMMYANYFNRDYKMRDNDNINFDIQRDLCGVKCDISIMREKMQNMHDNLNWHLNTRKIVGVTLGGLFAFIAICLWIMSLFVTIFRN